MAQRPASVAEIGELVRQAAALDQAIYPAGGRTQWDLGLPPGKPGFLLETRALNQIIDYPARDMTITVQAGVTVAVLQKILAAENQRLPVDIPHADRATVGGSVAAYVSGPRRYGCGTLRDYVIGISAVNDEGDEIKAGGRVVKNVAGYDLCKLFVGSLGTLGVITQVTFKVLPLPDEHGLFGFACPEPDLEEVLTQLHATRTRPVCLELLSPAAAPPGWPAEWNIIVGFEHNAEALKWQVQKFVHEVGKRFDVRGLLGHCANALWGQLAHPPAGNAALSFKAMVRPSALASFCRQANSLLDPMRLQAHAGNGIVQGHAQDTQPAVIARLRDLALAADGHLIVTRCPEALRTPELIWGPPRPDLSLMKTIKERLDPRRLFNPGRYLHGI